MLYYMSNKERKVHSVNAFDKRIKLVYPYINDHIKNLTIS